MTTGTDKKKLIENALEAVGRLDDSTFAMRRVLLNNFSTEKQISACRDLLLERFKTVTIAIRSILEPGEDR